jgi:hypothetical protein
LLCVVWRLSLDLPYIGWVNMYTLRYKQVGGVNLYSCQWTQTLKGRLSEINSESSELLKAVYRVVKLRNIFLKFSTIQRSAPYKDFDIKQNNDFTKVPLPLSILF